MSEDRRVPEQKMEHMPFMWKMALFENDKNRLTHKQTLNLNLAPQEHWKKQKSAPKGKWRPRRLSIADLYITSSILR